MYSCIIYYVLILYIDIHTSILYEASRSCSFILYIFQFHSNILQYTNMYIYHTQLVTTKKSVKRLFKDEN